LLDGILTQYLSWRWCLYVNLVFAAVAVFGAMTLLENHRCEGEAHLDIPGTVLATGGLFCLVFGLSHAETASWTDSVTLIMFAVALVALIGFVVSRARTRATSARSCPR
jgi:MFS family permease